MLYLMQWPTTNDLFWWPAILSLSMKTVSSETDGDPAFTATLQKAENPIKVTTNSAIPNSATFKIRSATFANFTFSRSNSWAFNLRHFFGLQLSPFLIQTSSLSKCFSHLKFVWKGSLQLSCTSTRPEYLIPIQRAWIFLWAITFWLSRKTKFSRSNYTWRKLMEYRDRKFG